PFWGTAMPGSFRRPRRPNAKERPMKVRGTVLARLGVMTGLAAAVLVGIVAATPAVKKWFTPEAPKPDATLAKEPSHELVRDAAGKPVQPPTIRLFAPAVKALGIQPVAAMVADQPRDLPPQIGTIAWDNEHLYSVRSRFPGELVEIGEYSGPNLGFPEVTGLLSPEERELAQKKTRPLAFGDPVKKGQLLAIVWSKDLGDKKAALIDAMIDLRRDTARLKDLEDAWRKGAISAATYYEAQRTVQKDRSAVLAAERTLR